VGKAKPVNVVLFHTGCFGPHIYQHPDGPNLPPHLDFCIRQYQLLNDNPVYFLTDVQNFPHLAQYKRVIPVAISEYTSDKIARFNALYDYEARNFWTVTATRLFYIENFMRAHDLHHVYHFENDVLIYFDIKKYDLLFQRLYKSIAITPAGPDKYATGFMYVADADALKRATDFFVNALELSGIEGLKRKYSLGMIHEMPLLWLCGNLTSHIELLPILPFGEFSRHHEDFRAIFDPASWGQFVGGTRTEGPGAKPEDHYIGQLLRSNPQYGVKWRTEDGLKMPYFVYDNNWVKINNLHIHSKNLKEFMSKC